MRPIPLHSTDLLYSSHFEQRDLIRLGEALGVSSINVVTKATLVPDRVLYHACLNGIQTYVKLQETGESQRAQEISKLADSMYDALIGEYQQRTEEAYPEQLRKKQGSEAFCAQLASIEDGKPWNPQRYHNSWNTNDFPPRWQKKAIETYATVRERIASGAFTPEPGESARGFALYWNLRNMEYKHYRDIARGLVEDYIETHIPKARQLTHHPSNGRVMTFFIGGMGSGKSAMTQFYLNQLPEDVRFDRVLHNADFLKPALYQRALKDGMLAPGHAYTGAEVQAESSNALYEGTRKRAYLARQKFCAPDVALNSIVLGSFEVQEGISGGGKVVAHHLFMPTEEAVKEAAHNETRGNRAPMPEDIRWSTAASAKSLLLLTQPAYLGTDVTVHLYCRESGQAPRHYGTIDSARATITTHRLDALADMARTAFPDAPNPLMQWVASFLDAGFVFHVVKEQDPTSPIATLAPNKRLTIFQASDFDCLAFNDKLRAIASIARVRGTLQPSGDSGMRIH